MIEISPPRAAALRELLAADPRPDRAVTALPTVEPSVGAVDAELLRWSIAFRLGPREERVAALRRLGRELRSSLSLNTVVSWFGDPWHRTAPRDCPVTGSRREMLSWRHPLDGRTQMQMLFRDERFEAAQFVIDGGACLPPRIMGAAEYWEAWDDECEGVRR
ncbi:MAG: hypothetical protein R3F20_10030 [Planctomycetota bacterium]